MSKLILLFLVFVVLPTAAFTQEFDPEKLVVIEMQDGARFTGRIVSSDAREIVLRTADRGDIALPKYSIKTIRDFEMGDDKVQEVFASRYFISTNAIPIREGESYINWTLLGPDIQFGYKDNLGFGLMTTWWASPVVLSVKRTIPLGGKRGIAVGALAGGTLWGSGGGSLILPYVAATAGDRNSNVTGSVGYALFGGSEAPNSNLILSIAGMAKMTRNGTFVFDSMILPGGTDPNDKAMAYLIPGIRIQTRPEAAFQFGFGGIVAEGTTYSVPYVSWFRAF